MHAAPRLASPGAAPRSCQRASRRFVIGKHGRPSALSVETGSGQPVLDSYALALMRQAAPLPPIPEHMHIDRLDAVLPLVFMLQGRPPPRAHAAGQVVACN
jgi:TonB family protein